MITRKNVIGTILILILMAGVIALGVSVRGDNVVGAPAVEEVAPPSLPGSTTTTVSPWAVAEFLFLWSEAEKKTAYDLFQAEQARLDAEAEAARQAGLARQREQQAARSYTPPPAQTYSGGGSCAIPDYICSRESGYNYGAVNSSSGAGGMYQFMPSTWDATANQMGRSDLVGTHPSQASPGDQDAVAAYLWNGGAGCGHWAAC